MSDNPYPAPGPWRLSSDWRVVSEHRECRNAIAQVFCMNDWAEGNASLIAAAPELLEALECLERQSGLPLVSDDPARIAARAAIAKARGEE